MADPTIEVTREIDKDTKKLVLVWMWDFEEAIAPQFGNAFTCKATWSPAYIPDEVQNLTGAVTSWAKPVPADASSTDPELVIGASLTLPRRYYRGTVEIELTWTVQKTGKSQSFKHSETLGNQLNATQNVSLNTKEPALSYALMAPLTDGEKQASQTTTTEPSDPADVHTYRGELIQETIAAIHSRLRTGLGLYWRAMGANCRDSSGQKALSELRGAELDSLTVQELDECWAQLVAEFFTSTCYHGPGSHLALTPWGFDAMSPDEREKRKGEFGHLRDSRYNRYVRFRAMGQLVPDTDTDPPGALGGEKEYTVALCFACQQLATAVLMSRSPDFLELAENPIYCMRPKQYGKLTGKTTYEGDKGAMTGEELVKEGWLVPGACYYQADKYAHVAIVMRAYQSTRIQMMDTGAYDSSQDPIPKPTDDPGTYAQINYDTQARDKLVRALHAVLIPPAINDANKTKLIDGIKVFQNGRPLGFMRLVIYQRGQSQSKSTLLYASRKLFMNEGTTVTDYRYYTIASLLASLRACPHADRLDIRWQIFRPFGDAALREACNNGRTQRWWEWDSSTNPTQPPSSMHFPIMELSVTSEGLPRVRQRNAQYTAKQVQFAENDIRPLEAVCTQAEIEDARTNKKYSNLADVDNSKLPAFFQK